jgi:hypothetical protein
MVLWKQNLLAYALAAAVAFEILSLCSCAFHDTMVPLPETALRMLFTPEYLAVTLSRCIGCHECQQIFVPSEKFLILERA